MNFRFSSLLLVALFAGCAAREPRNLTIEKWAATEYHDSGRYLAQFSLIAEDARNYLRQRVANSRPGEKLAVVFDIDETLLSNWPFLQQFDYSFALPLVNRWLNEGRSLPLDPTLALYQEAVALRVPVFLITGRHPEVRPATVANLKRYGVTQIQGLYLRPAGDTNTSVVPFKSGARQAITDQGYRIILNIGDQWSDLEGGFAERAFKLPNPFYYIE